MAQCCCNLEGRMTSFLATFALLLIFSCCEARSLTSAALADPILLPSFLLLQLSDLLGSLVSGLSYQITRAAIFLLWV